MNVDEMLGIDRNDPLTQRAKILEDEIVGMLESLARVRRKNDLTQSDVAELMGVDPSFISRIESGRNDLHLSTLKRYAWAVGATLDITVDSHMRERMLPRSDPWTIPASEASEIWPCLTLGVS